MSLFGFTYIALKLSVLSSKISYLLLQRLLCIVCRFFLHAILTYDSSYLRLTFLKFSSYTVLLSFSIVFFYFQFPNLCMAFIQFSLSPIALTVHFLLHLVHALLILSSLLTGLILKFPEIKFSTNFDCVFCDLSQTKAFSYIYSQFAFYLLDFGQLHTHFHAKDLIIPLKDNVLLLLNLSLQVDQHQGVLIQVVPGLLPI